MLKTILLFILILFKVIVKGTQKLKLRLAFSYWLFNTFYMSQYFSVGSIPSSPIQNNPCPCVLWVWHISSQEVAGKDLSLPRGWNPNSEFSNCTTSLWCQCVSDCEKDILEIAWWSTDLSQSMLWDNYKRPLIQYQIVPFFTTSLKLNWYFTEVCMKTIC